MLRSAMFGITQHLWFITSAAVLDGVSTSQQVIFLVMLFSSLKPVRNSIAYITGIAGAYICCGLFGLLSIDKLNEFLKKFFPSLSEPQGLSYYQTQLIFGIVLVVMGIFHLKKRKAGVGVNQSRFLLFLKKINPPMSFLFGTFVSSTSFPTAIPYIGALEKMATSEVSFGGKFFLLLYYNFIYILPTIVPFVIYVVLRKRSDDIEQRIHIHAERVNSFLTLLMLAGIGLYFIADSFCYFLLSHPLFQTRLF